MKIRLVDLHLYISLLCAPYLVLYGISTISFNHDWAWMSPVEETRTWEETVENPGQGNATETAARLRDSLGLIGMLPNWELRPADDGLRFLVWRPGKQYDITWSEPAAAVSVIETRSGLWGALRDMHGLWGLDDSLWSRAWGMYTVISIAGLLFSIGTGLWLWWRRPQAGKTGWGPLLWGSGVAMAFMLYIIW